MPQLYRVISSKKTRLRKDIDDSLEFKGPLISQISGNYNRVNFLIEFTTPVNLVENVAIRKQNS